MGDSVHSQVIMTDKEVALMNAISIVFPIATHLLYKWHISRNVLAKCKQMFLTKENWDRLIMSWNLLVLSALKENYFQNISSLNHKYSTYPDALKYV